MFYISYPINKINAQLIKTKVIYLGYGFKYIWILKFKISFYENQTIFFY